MKYKMTLTTAVIAAISLGGCGHMVSKEEMDKQLAQKVQLIERCESDSSNCESELVQLQRQLRAERATVAQLESQVRKGTMKSAQSADAMPANARPGECFSKVFIPPKYKTVTEEVVEREAYDKVETMPGKYEWVTKKILVKEPGEKVEVIPAKYEWKTEKVVVKPAITKMVAMPAKYKTVTEKVLERPAHTVWKQGNRLYTDISKQMSAELTKELYDEFDREYGKDRRAGVVDIEYGKRLYSEINQDPETMCLVEIPAKYKTITKKVLAAPATSKEVVVTPAQTKTVRKKVMLSPPKTRKIHIPAEYKTIRIQQEVEPPKTRRIPVPAKYKTITKKVAMTEPDVEWRPVLCEVNMTVPVIRQLQQALKQQGYYRGAVDGVIGGQTLRAVENYQRTNGLERGGITIQTMDRLNIAVAK